MIVQIISFPEILTSTACVLINRLSQNLPIILRETVNHFNAQLCETWEVIPPPPPSLHHYIAISASAVHTQGHHMHICRLHYTCSRDFALRMTVGCPGSRNQPSYST
jgi:hypothetical protein